VSNPPPFWDAPPELQPRFRIIAGTCWLGLGIGFFIAFVGTWGFLFAAIFLWALVAIPAALVTMLWLRPTGGVRLMAARLLFVSCCAITIAGFVLAGALLDWKRSLPYVIFGIPLALSLWGAVLGFLGRPAHPRASA
jgi:hypothetical protein